MARGWESKSVEQQMEEARDGRAATKSKLSPEEAARSRQRDALQMSRARVLQQLDNCRDPRYEQMLRSALAELDARLAKLAEPQRAV